MSENKFNLPESSAHSFESFHLPKHLKNVGIMSDLHTPYHNIPAIDEALSYFIAKNVDCILLNGDILDFYQQSRFEPDPRERHFKDELQAFKELIGVIQSHVTRNIFYKLGNHEERYERHMIKYSAEFLDIDVFSFENVTGCIEMGVTVIKDKRIVMAGNLPVYHGHEIAMRSAIVNPARTLYLKTGASGICSHLHVSSQHSQNTVRGSQYCYSTGHMGEEHPKYLPVNQWNLGCARIEKDESGDFEVINFGLRKNKLFAVTA
jgi:predicted phosphodiesterase